MTEVVRIEEYCANVINDYTEEECGFEGEVDVKIISLNELEWECPKCLHTHTAYGEEPGVDDDDDWFYEEGDDE